MTKLVAVRVALAWATNVQKMLRDAKRFKKALNCVETNVVAPSVCVKFSSVGDSQLTVLVIQKNISTPVEKLYIVCFQKDTFGLQN